MNRKKKQDRDAALLALFEAGIREQEGQTPSCLSDEELALLLENDCNDEKRRSGWEHLAHCEECLRRWMVLYSSIHGNGQVRYHVRGMWIRRLFWGGMVLAACAMVAIFFNITVQKSITIDQTPVTRETAPSTLETVARRAGRNGQPEIRSAPAKPAHGKRWLDMVRSACRAQVQDPAFWRSLRKQMDPERLIGADRQTVMNLLPAIDALAEGKRELQRVCAGL